MPYKRHEPIAIEEMNRKDYEGHHSICQTLRDIYHSTEDEGIRLKARLAMSMAKAMLNKLKKYKAQEDARRTANGVPK